MYRPVPGAPQQVLKAPSLNPEDRSSYRLVLSVRLVLAFDRRFGLTVFEGIDGEVEDLGVEVGVADGDGRVFPPEMVELPAEQRVVVPGQGVVPAHASGPGAVVVRVGGVVEGQVQREAAHRKQRRHDEVDGAEADQSLYSICTLLLTKFRKHPPLSHYKC